MFDHNHGHLRGGHRRRRGEMRDALRGEAGRQLRAELRRNLRHGAGPRGLAFGELFGQGRRGGIVRRGQIRPLILGALRQKPMHGYEVIQELEARSEGRWRPSAGSVYPTLQLLSDEGLVTSEEFDGRRTYTLTEAGRKAADEAGTGSPWTENEDAGAPDIRRLAMELAAAVMQVNRVGSPRAHGEATRILTDARKQLYRLLAEDDADSGEGTSQDTDPA